MCVSYLLAEQSSYYVIFNKYYNKLASIIQVKHLVNHFVSEHIISVKEKDSITADSLLQMVAMQLKNGIYNSFTKLLDIMQQFGNLETESLAKSIKSELNPEFAAVSSVQDTAIDFNIIDDVESMFRALAFGLNNMLSKVNSQPLRRCILINKTVIKKYPTDVIQNIFATSTADQLIDVLIDSPGCNWMNVYLLEKIALASRQRNAYQLIQKYKEAVLAKKLKDVFGRIPNIQITEDYCSKVREKWHKEFDDLTIKDVVGHWNKLEKFFDVDKLELLLDRVLAG